MDPVWLWQSTAAHPARTTSPAPRKVQFRPGLLFPPFLSILAFIFTQVQHIGSVNLLSHTKQLSEAQFTTSSLYKSSDLSILAVSLDTVKTSLGSLTIPSFISVVRFSSLG